MKKAYILLADGFETIEALTPVDVFQRCGIDVLTVSISDDIYVHSSHKLEVRADMMLLQNTLSDGDLIVIPGGYPGYVNLCENKFAGEILRNYQKSGKLIAAICGGPTVLKKNGICKGRNIICHTSVKDRMTDYIIASQGTGVVVDGNLITGAGAGRSLEFSLILAEILTDSETVDNVRRKMEI